MKKLIALLLALVMVLSLAACGAKTEAPAPAPETPKTEEVKTEEVAAPAEVDWANVKIDFSKIPQEKLDTTLYLAASVRDPSSPYIATIIKGMEMFAEFLRANGQKCETQVLDSGADSVKEVDNMRQFAAKANGNAIAYADPNESSIAYSLAEAMAESGGYIGTAWNKDPDVAPADLTPNWVTHTSPDDSVNGYLIAKALFEYMGGEGKIFVCQGMLGNSAATGRYEGLQKALAEYPNIVVAGDDTGNWLPDEAMTLVETWLTQHPDVKGVWCANDNMATGALKALDNAGLKGKVGVVGIDANTDIVEGVRDGYVVATVSSNGYVQGGYTLAICYAAWAGLIDVAEMPNEYREFATPAKLIDTPAAAEEYLNSVPEFDFADIFWCKAD